MYIYYVNCLPSLRCPLLFQVNQVDPDEHNKNNQMMAYAHKSQRYPSKLVLLSTTFHCKVMFASGRTQRQFQLAKG